MIPRSVLQKKETLDELNGELNCGLKYSDDISCLKENVLIDGKIVPNRIVYQPMEGCDASPDGSPGELTERRYLRFASGGAGIIWFEAVSCLPEGRANPRQLMLNDENVDKYKILLEKIRETAIKENGCAPLIIMQNTHSGRYSRPNGVPEPVIAYNNELFEKDKPIDRSRIISDEGLDRVKESLVKNSVLAEKAGFDGVDVKCCHRYLNSELLSAYEREGRYGGSFENRTRLLRESVEGSMQSVSKGFIVSSRLNVYDGFPYPYGFGVRRDGSSEFDKTEPVKLIKELKMLGVKIIDITMGNPYFNPHVNRPFAIGPYVPEEHPAAGVARMLNGITEIHRDVPSVKVVSSGLSWLGTLAPNIAAAYIKDGGFDFAGFGRMSLAYPDLAKDIIEKGALDKKKICLACSKCTELMRSPGGTPGCVVKDPLYTKLYRQLKG